MLGGVQSSPCMGRPSVWPCPGRRILGPFALPLSAGAVRPSGRGDRRQAERQPRSHCHIREALPRCVGLIAWAPQWLPRLAGKSGSARRSLHRLKRGMIPMLVGGCGSSASRSSTCRRPSHETGGPRQGEARGFRPGGRRREGLRCRPGCRKGQRQKAVRRGQNSRRLVEGAVHRSAGRALRSSSFHGRADRHGSANSSGTHSTGGGCAHGAVGPSASEERPRSPSPGKGRRRFPPLEDAMAHGVPRRAPRPA